MILFLPRSNILRQNRAFSPVWVRIDVLKAPIYKDLFDRSRTGHVAHLRCTTDIWKEQNFLLIRLLKWPTHRGMILLTNFGKQIICFPKFVSRIVCIQNQYIHISTRKYRQLVSRKNMKMNVYWISKSVLDAVAFRKNGTKACLRRNQDMQQTQPIIKHSTI